MVSKGGNTRELGSRKWEAVFQWEFSTQYSLLFMLWTEIAGQFAMSIKAKKEWFSHISFKDIEELVMLSQQYLLLMWMRMKL